MRAHSLLYLLKLNFGGGREEVNFQLKGMEPVI